MMKRTAAEAAFRATALAQLAAEHTAHLQSIRDDVYTDLIDARDAQQDALNEWNGRITAGADAECLARSKRLVTAATDEIGRLETKYREAKAAHEKAENYEERIAGERLKHNRRATEIAKAELITEVRDLGRLPEA